MSSSPETNVNNNANTKKIVDTIRLMGGEITNDQQQPIFDAENQIRISNLLKQWGTNLSCSKDCNDARQKVDDYRKNNKDSAELFTFNPYRPQGGQGFPGKDMWISLLAETTNLSTSSSKKKKEDQDENDENEEVRRRIAKIFRVDPIFNEKIQENLKKQDEKVEEVKKELTMTKT